MVMGLRSKRVGSLILTCVSLTNCIAPAVTPDRRASTKATLITITPSVVCESSYEGHTMRVTWVKSCMTVLSSSHPTRLSRLSCGMLNHTISVLRP